MTEFLDVVDRRAAALQGHLSPDTYNKVVERQKAARPGSTGTWGWEEGTKEEPPAEQGPPKEPEMQRGSDPETTDPETTPPSAPTSAYPPSAEGMTLADVMRGAKAAQAKLDSLYAQTEDPEELIRLKEAEVKLGEKILQQENEIAEVAKETIQKDWTTREAVRNAQREAETMLRGDLDRINQKMLNYEIDPRRAFKSTWQVVGAALAAAAGAFAQGLHSKNIPNTALLLIERAIARDIKAQEAELKTLGTTAELKQNVLAHLVRSNSDELRSLSEAQIIARETAILALQQQVNATKNEKAKAAGEYLMEELRTRSAAESRRAKIQIATNQLNGWLRLAGGFGGRGRGKDKDELSELEKAGINAKMENLKEHLKALDTGEGILEVSDAFEARWTQKLKDWGMVELANLWSDPDAEGRARNYISMGLMTVTEIAKAYQGGRGLSDRDMKSYLAVLPDINMLVDDDAKEAGVARLDAVIEFFESPKWANATPDARSNMIYMKAIDMGTDPRIFAPDGKFRDPVKQQIFEAARENEKAARKR